MRKNLIFIIGSLFFGYAFMIQVAPGAMYHELMQHFSIDATALGFLASSFFWAYALMQIPAGLLLDRYGAKKVLVTAFLICSLGSLLFCTADNFTTAILARVLMGASSAFAFTGAIYLIIRWFAPKRLAPLVGVLQMVGAIGAILAGPLLTEAMRRYQWHTTLMAFAIIGFILTISSLVLIKDRPHKTKKQTKNQYSVKEALQIIAKNPQSWYNAAYSFMIWGPILAFAALWGVSFMETAHHLTIITATNCIAVIWLGVAIGSPLAGGISEKIQKRCLPLTTAALIGLASSLIALYDTNLPLPLLYIIMFLIGLAASGQTLIFAVVKDNNSIHTASTANGFNNMAVVLSGVVLQPFIGKLLDFSWSGLIDHGARVYDLHTFHHALLILPFCFIFAAIISTFFIKETYCQPVHHIDDALALATLRIQDV